MIDPREITGLVLAGGQGSRLGGVDKGLQLYGEHTLAWHALQRLSAQVGNVMISANRHLDVYRHMGVPVWPDGGEPVGYEGPLAGFAAGLAHTDTPYLATVPCDSPLFPRDLVQRLAEQLESAQADIAVAATLHDGSAEHDRRLRLEPVFCLMKRDTYPSLLGFMQSGQRKIERWTATLRRTEVLFDDVEAFFNVNTPEDLARLPLR